MSRASKFWRDMPSYVRPCNTQQAWELTAAELDEAQRIAIDRERAIISDRRYSKARRNLALAAVVAYEVPRG